MPQGTQTKDARMKRTLETWLANPLATFEEIAASAGVSDITFWRYRQDADFMKEYHEQQRQRFSSLEGKAIAQLENKLDDGEWKAIQYTLDGLGYKPTEKIEAKADIHNYTVGFDDE